MSGPSCEVPARSEADIFGLAQAVRTDLKISADDFPIIEFLELGMPLLFEGFSFELGTYAQMGSNHGLTIPSENVIRLREDVYEGCCSGRGRDRFTAAHELGHYLMHRNAAIKFHRAENGRLPAYLDSEWQANRFAGGLLMPELLMKSCASLDEVVNRFKVSRDAAIVQNKVLAKKNKMQILS
ncbi:ImmA/IrrE family metallo-endopeptidase [Pseudomonas qingdaonensis]|uniref:ImmA/IrrE family metallo-endopeptidase n=1 Tax=Pseudomonas qingdaonensis TaxID=2056231 RepID=UPI0036A6F77E